MIAFSTMPKWSNCGILLCLILALLVLVPPTRRCTAADIADARAAYYAGKYDQCIELTRAEVEKGIWNDFWSRQLIEALLTTGRYEDAREVYELVETKFSNSIPLRLLAADVYRFSGMADKGNKLLDDIPALVQAASWRYADRENMLAIGRYLVSQGEDARIVLEMFYDRCLKSDPKFVDAHVAIAELALDKADYQEAAKSLDKALELRPQDPAIRFLLAKAWAPSDSEKAAEYLASALELNPSHADSLLLQARNMIDAEVYDEAEKVLAKVFEVNAFHPQAWALRAAIAHLQGNYLKEGEFRSNGLKHWDLNPEVDSLIGVTLSKHYRFSEGVQYQRRALRMRPKYMPAKFQLAQDLLRAGADEEGWMIVDQVAAEDQYNVVAFNLKTLADRLAQFSTIEVPGLIIRMDAREAKIYGPRVVELLQQAKQSLCQKYDYELTQPVTVEIFPQQSDFAIRTFGLPGGAGFLGVCFGSLITANSPASQGDAPSNWESVLWHEFCHVVTLQKTKNRMPRWLSEGISVFEELERDASWGQSMSPVYKSMILGEDFVPLSELSGAFLNPKSPMHLQFAYYESSLAVRYLVEKHGLPLLLKLLVDLGVGVPVDQAFARLYGDTDVLDEDFAEFAKGMANAFAADTDFAREGLPKRASPLDLEQWMKDHPRSYYGQLQIVEQLVQGEKWEEAFRAAQKLDELLPNNSDPGGTLELLAQIARKLENTEAERKYLEQITRLSSDNLPALLRLEALYREAENWAALAANSSKLLAVQPLIATGHEGAAAAAKGLHEPAQAVDSLRALQELEPLDPAGLHYKLSEALLAANQLEAARLEILMALEQSPRYRAAQMLLVKILDRRQAVRRKIQVSAPEDGSPPVPRQ